MFLPDLKASSAAPPASLKQMALGTLLLLLSPLVSSTALALVARARQGSERRHKRRLSLFSARLSLRVPWLMLLLKAASATSDAHGLADVSHYHAFSQPTRMPDATAIQGPLPSEPPLTASNVAVAILASCALPARLKLVDETWCGADAAWRCAAYVDCEAADAPSTAAVRVVPLSEYALPWHKPLEHSAATSRWSPTQRSGTGPAHPGAPQAYSSVLVE